MSGPEEAYRGVAEMLAGLSRSQLIFLGLAALSWLGGGNLVIALHHRRRGMPLSTGFRPFVFPFAEFNAKEWVALAICAALSVFFGHLSLR